MKRLLLVVCLLLSTLASASDYLTVTGTGKTFEEAKQQAFRKAIEFKVGATVLSDVETQNYQRVKDEIYVYSAGYVDDYKVLGQENSASGITVMLNVSVAESKLKNRIIGSGKDSATFNGEQHAAQVGTYVQEKAQADRLFQKVLDGYPFKAYNVKQPKPYRIIMNDQRRPMIMVAYELSWNFEYLQSLRETLGTIEDCTNTWTRGCNYKINVVAKDPNDWVPKVTNYYFNDPIRNDQLHNWFIAGTPRIVIDLYDMYNNRIHTTCYTPRFIWGGNEGFYHTGNQFRATIEGKTVETGYFGIPLALTTIEKTTRLELSVQKGNCN